MGTHGTASDKHGWGNHSLTIRREQAASGTGRNEAADLLAEGPEQPTPHHISSHQERDWSRVELANIRERSRPTRGISLLGLASWRK